MLELGQSVQEHEKEVKRKKQAGKNMTRVNDGQVWQ